MCVLSAFQMFLEAFLVVLFQQATGVGQNKEVMAVLCMLHRNCGPAVRPESATEVKPVCETAAASDPLRPDLKV